MLGEQALRLTPADGGDRGDRLLGLAEYLERAGERQRVTDLVAPALESLPHGRQRARAWLLSPRAAPSTATRSARALRTRAGREHGRPRPVRARAGDAGVQRRHVASADSGGARRPRSRRRTARRAAHLCVLGWARCLRGQRFDDVCERFRASSHGAVPPRRLAGAGHGTAALVARRDGSGPGDDDPVPLARR